jgi:hypothetical protein
MAGKNKTGRMMLAGDGRLERPTFGSGDHRRKFTFLSLFFFYLTDYWHNQDFIFLLTSLFLPVYLRKMLGIVLGTNPFGFF